MVTGGAGFIGANLCARLVAEGNEVVCLDNLSSGLRSNVAALEENSAFRFVEHDVCEPYRAEVDAIYHLACPASPPFYQADPIQTARTCFLGMQNMLELATELDVPILYTSTSEVYGDPLEHPQRESYRGNVSCTGPRACYDEGKRVAEALCFDYLRASGTDVRVVRIFNTYGPGMRPDDGRVVSNLVWRALRGEDLEVYGGGSQTRSFCYVDDLVEGLVRMMAAEDFHGPVNLGKELLPGVRARLCQLLVQGALVGAVEVDHFHAAGHARCGNALVDGLDGDHPRRDDEHLRAHVQGLLQAQDPPAGQLLAHVRVVHHERVRKQRLVPLERFARVDARAVERKPLAPPGGQRLRQVLEAPLLFREEGARHPGPPGTSEWCARARPRAGPWAPSPSARAPARCPADGAWDRPPAGSWSSR